MPDSSVSDAARSTAPAWTAGQTRAQFVAIAWLRWRIAVNGLRRKGGSGELIARLLLYPIFASLALGPTVGAGIVAFFFASSGHLDRIAWLLWATFILCQLLNIQLGQPGSTFDPTQLIRFPVRLGSYTAIRLFFGLLTPGNVMGVLMSFAIALGILIAIPALWFNALLALAVFASANVLFSRMIFAWVDRWLATRRAREIFTALIFAFSLGIQWLNFSYNPAYNRHHGHADPAQRLSTIGHLYERAKPFLHALPPELTASSLVVADGGHLAGFFRLTLACALFSAAFLSIFGLRMRTEFRGENLSDTANAIARTARNPVKSSPVDADEVQTLTSTVHPDGRSAFQSNRGLFQLSPVVSAMLGKELLYVRRNTGLFYSLIAPVVLVFLFAGRLAAGGNSFWIFPAALTYTMLGITPLSYNSFGLEGTGSQFYFLAPIRLRDVFLAKNLINFLLASVEAAAVFCIISYVAGMPSPQIAAVSLLWVAATLLLSTTVGNRRSISAPRQIKTVRASGKQASPLSALIGMGLLLLSAAIAGLLVEASIYFDLQWAMLPAFTVFFLAALFVYLHSLGSLEHYAAQHREEIFSELCKKT